ncbi:MAG: hypothetical protein K6G25_06290 [Bacteroidales bacterium]|nr:hypothetical protein [Bacteroidales bacterium]
MKVKELIEHLEGLNQDSCIWLNKDLTQAVEPFPYKVSEDDVNDYHVHKNDYWLL